MIDAHCHMEQHDYDKDRDEIIQACKASGLKAIITCCAHPRDWELTMQMVERHSDFVFACAAIHPEYIKDLQEHQIEEFIELLKSNKEKIVAIGETGLDYKWTKEHEWRAKQAELFRKFIAFSKKLHKPLVIHARDAYDEVVKILEEENAKRVMLHMFGANQLVKRIVDNGWFVSMNAIVLKSKKHGKVIRDVPLGRLMLETDSPWLSPAGGRNDPRSIKAVAEKIAEIKKLQFDEVWQKTAENAVELFSLDVRL